MRVVYKNGDLLKLRKSEAQVIVQQCNCSGSTEKGLSKDMMNAFPHSNFYRDGLKRIPGKIRVKGGGNDRYICAMFAQKYPGKPNLTDDTIKMRISWFRECLNNISLIKNLRSIAFPDRIGCGLAGGNWETYKHMIEEWSQTLERDIKIFVYTKQ